MLKIGTLCWVVGCRMAKFRAHNGIVTKIVGPLQLQRNRAGELEWVYQTKDATEEFYTRPRNLIPFSDPDISRPEHTLKPVERVA